MKKIIIIISIVFFFLGFLLSGFTTQYFRLVQYTPDILIANSYSSGRTGAISTCFVRGKLKSNGKKAGMSCDMFNEYFPELKIKDLMNPDPEEKKTYEVAVFVSPQGGLHMYSESKAQYVPGVKRLPLMSYQTFLMIPLPLIMIYFLGVRFFKN